jgi:thiol-disulfide isomerase/thioredoxin
MGDALKLGPLLLPLELLVVLAAVGCMLLVGKRIGTKASGDVESALWYALFVGLVGARIAFVFEYRSLYFASPLAILDIRDGGWNAGVGLATVWLYALYRWRSSPALAKPMRWSLVAGTIVFVAGTGYLTFRPHDGQPLPDLAFTSVEGKEVRLASFVGKPTVVNLWATWCPPCVREMPVLQQAQIDRQDVHFVFLNQGEPASLVARWIDVQGLALRNVLIDEARRASAAFKQQGYPTTLFFDSRGQLVSRRIGERSAATLSERLAHITSTSSR